MAKYFKIAEIDASTFECMTGNELDCLQVTMLADDGNGYVAVDEDRQDYIDVDLETFSTTDVAPVVHGQWIRPHWKNSNYCCDCSECGGEAMHRDYQWHKNGIYPICPNCGARMDGDSNALD